MSEPRATVLVVDDHRLNRELVTDLLSSAGFRVREAFTAEAGLASARNDPPDLILMDIGLPDMDGHAAVRLLKAAESTRHIITIALTAFAMAGDAERAVESGFDGYISKPIHTRTFALTVAGLLKGKGTSP